MQRPIEVKKLLELGEKDLESELPDALAKPFDKKYKEYAVIMIAFIEHLIAKKDTDTFAKWIEEETHYFGLLPENGEDQGLIIYYLNILSEQTYKKGAPVALQVLNLAVENNLNFVKALEVLMKTAIKNYKDNSDESIVVTEEVQYDLAAKSLGINIHIYLAQEGEEVKCSKYEPKIAKSPSPEADILLDDRTIVLLVTENENCIIYDKKHPCYAAFSKEKESYQSTIKAFKNPCKLCQKFILNDQSKHKCPDDSIKMHQDCLKKYIVDSTDEKVVGEENLAVCPFCGKEIDVEVEFDSSESAYYRRNLAVDKAKKMRSESLSGYTPKLKKVKKGISKERKVRVRESSKERVEKHDFVCDLCGKACTIDYVENRTFVHNIKECKGGCSHKACIISMLAMHFGRKYPKHLGKKIIFLTENERLSLKKEWVCPSCRKELSFDELKSLVTEREWMEQVRMMNERKSRESVPLKTEDELADEHKHRKKAEGKGEGVSTNAKFWEISKEGKLKLLLGLVILGTLLMVFIANRFWSNMILPESY